MAVEISSPELMPNAFFRITMSLLDTHKIEVSTVIFVEKGKIAKSRHNEKQRMRVALAYKAKKLPIISSFHVHLN